MKVLAWVIVGIGAGAVALASVPREQRLSSFATSLFGRTASQRHNSKLALEHLLGVTVPPGETFSFNQRVGTFSRDEGYRKAPVSYNGQLIDDWGGGVCQTSTTLYNAALLAGMTIIERHRHRFAPSYISPGRDAAVAFSNIDLRFTNPYAFAVRIEGSVVGDSLKLEFVGSHPLPAKPEVVQDVTQISRPIEFRLGEAHGPTHVRNSGKQGCEVTVYRIIGDRRELISSDTYPAMNRVVQYRQ